MSKAILISIAVSAVVSVFVTTLTAKLYIKKIDSFAADVLNGLKEAAGLSAEANRKRKPL